MAKLKAGDTPYLKCSGYGLISYEIGEEVLSIRKGIVRLENRDTKYDAFTGEPIGGGSLGLTVSICIDPVDIAAAKRYIADND